MVFVIDFIILMLSCLFIIVWVYSLLNKKIYIIDLSSADLLNYKKYFLYLFCVSLSLLILIILAVLLNYLLRKKKDNPSWFKKIVEKFMFYVNKFNIFFKAYSLIFEYFGPGSSYSDLVMLCGKSILNLNKNINYLIISFFVFLPRLFIVTVFLWEISKGQLHYYFYSLYLLFIPLLFRLLLFILNDIPTRVLPEMRKMIIQEDIDQPFMFNGVTCKGLVFKLIPEFSDINPDLFFHQYYYPMLFLEGHMNSIIMPLYHKITKLSMFFYYLVHCLGFGYLLFLSIYS